MYLKLRDDYRDILHNPVPSKFFWGTIVVIAVLVGTMSYTSAWNANHAAWNRFGEWLWFAVIWVFAVSSVLIEYAQHKRWKFPFVLFAPVVSVTFSTLGHQFPHSLFAAQWVQFIGNAMLYAMLLSFYVEFGWGRPLQSPPTQSPSSDT